MNNMQKYRTGWDALYEKVGNPFDLDRPYQWVVDLDVEARIRGRVLDAGCGAGHNAIYLAGRGYDVVGVDVSSNAIERARVKAAAVGVTVEFAQANVAELTGYEHRFDTVIDIGCFHSLDEVDYAKYAWSLHQSCRSGAIVHLRAFCDLNARRVGYTGPAVSEQQIQQAFSRGWSVANLEQKEIEVTLSPVKTRKAYAWFAEIRRD